MRMAKVVLTIFVVILLAACRTEIHENIKIEMAKAPEVIDYNFHVKPILADRCYACHGPDTQKQKANLRLDIEEIAYAALTSGNGHAIVPGNINKSQLVRRIVSDEKDYAMPPAESNLSLDNAEKAILIKWIEQGAKYQPHWAFLKPEEPSVPANENNWAVNEIDHFIADRLNDYNLKPAPEANKEQLIRRVFFDITGLPPSINDLDRWLAKSRPDYYELLVDSLLNLPAYGQRMAAHWLDVARFADSEGYLDDFHHTFWPYRDWVIKAFNDNLSYDQFILWQVGGDQIPNATSEQVLATAFNRNHKQNSEGGVIPEEFRVEYVVDRTNTLGSAFMGLTVGCARCHDHKYDPVSQEDYYKLFGFFNSVIERGDAIFSNNSVENGQMVPNRESMNSGPVLVLFDDETEAIRQFLVETINAKTDGLRKLENANETEFQKWMVAQNSDKALAQAVEQSTVNYLTFDDMAEGKVTDLAQGAKKARYNGKIAPVPGKKGLAVRSDAQGQLVADGSRVVFERMDPYTISFWINTPKIFEDAHVMYNGNSRYQGYRGWDVTLDSGRVHFRLNHAHPYQSLDIRTPDPLPIGEWVHFVWTYDGSSNAERMSIYRNGEKIRVDIERNYIRRSARPYINPKELVRKNYRGLIIGNRHYDQDFTGGMVDELRILNREADAYVAKYLYNAEMGTSAYAQALKSEDKQLGKFYDLFMDNDLETYRVNLRRLQAQEIELIDTAQEVMVMGDFTKERATYILDRGVYYEQGQEVSRDVPEAILAMPDDLPRNRLGLGQWLIHPDHPLTARVAVNQIWYLVFGRGIVETVEDFGNQGALPTHPELLEWLATDFQKNGWDMKRLIRQMVTSATYRQSSIIRPELLEIDPDNKLLARGPRYRRSAEMIRDNILSSSGLLDNKFGGISTFPYQPDGLWKEVMTHTFFHEYEIDYENGLYRRSIYTFWKRNMPPPNMMIFDAASRAECQVRRQRSNTPLQALVLLNDPQMIEGCRVLAEKAWTISNGNQDEAISNIFRQLTSRYPTEKEEKILNQQYGEELKYFKTNPKNTLDYLNIGKATPVSSIPKPELAAMGRVSNTILNSTEAYFKN